MKRANNVMSIQRFRVSFNVKHTQQNTVVYHGTTGSGLFSIFQNACCCLLLLCAPKSTELFCLMGLRHVDVACFSGNNRKKQNNGYCGKEKWINNSLCNFFRLRDPCGLLIGKNARVMKCELIGTLFYNTFQLFLSRMHFLPR